MTPLRTLAVELASGQRTSRSLVEECLAAIDDPVERAAAYQARVDRMYEVGKGVSMADHHEIDDVIDPADSRRWITTALRAAPPPPARTGKKRPMVDTW